MRDQYEDHPARNGVLITIGCIVALVLVCGLFVGGCAGVKSFQRSQKRADVNNAVQITHTKIRVAQQQAQVVHAP
jgi:Na+-transporting NADH:ubiquinone oxidoreductase subunit NqrC